MLPAPAHQLSSCSHAVPQFTGKDTVLNISCRRELGLSYHSFLLDSVGNISMTNLLRYAYFDFEFEMSYVTVTKHLQTSNGFGYY